MDFSLPNDVTYFGLTDYRGQQVSFGIRAEDRSRHMYVIGKTGMGKSTLLENMAAQDILRGNGISFIDPHGSAIETLLEYIPEHRAKDVIYFAPFDSEFPVAFNVMESIGHDKRHLVVSGIMSTFKKIWADAWSARMEYILNNTLLALLEYPQSTLLGVNRMYSDKGFRQEVVSRVTDPSVLAFWRDEFGKWDEKFAREATAAIQNKIGQFTANPMIRNIIGQPVSSFDIRDAMDNNKILLINLSKGRIGEQNAGLLGGMIITKLYLSAMSRADVPKHILKNLPPFFLFVDEFQNFANDSFADILAEARKYKLNLTVAHQYIDQMEESVASAVFGNVGTTISFRVGPMDAETLEKVFMPTFTQEDIVNLGKYQIYLSLMIDGVGSKPFSANTLSTIPVPSTSFRQEALDASRAQFANPREAVEGTINKWMAHEFAFANPKIKPRDDGAPMGPRRPTDSPYVRRSDAQQAFAPKTQSSIPRERTVNSDQEYKSKPIADQVVSAPRSPASTAPQSYAPKSPRPSVGPVRTQSPRVQQHVAESLTSSSLSSLLATLAPDDDSIAKAQPAIPQPQQPESRPVEPANERPSLAKKDATSTSKNSLKEALARAMAEKSAGQKSTQTQAPTSTPAPDLTPVVSESRAPVDIVQNVVSAPPRDTVESTSSRSPSRADQSAQTSSPLVQQKIREVPEDVLRRILES